MTDNAKAFLEKMSNDEALQAELNAVLMDAENTDRVASIIEFAKNKGYELVKEDFQPKEEDVSLNELEAVNGGGGCGCALYGGGKGDGLNCGCMLIGAGFVNGAKKITSQGGCACGVAGAGATRRH